MEHTCFLGFDLGTSGLRGLLIDSQQRTIASHEVGYVAAHPHKGWSEQEPSIWTDAADAVAKTLKQKAPDAWRAVAGIGVSGHMHGAVLLDADGQVIRPCILWNDTRSHGQAAFLDQQEGVREISGNIVFPGFTAPKLMWVAEHEPEHFGATAKVVLPAGYMNFWLTGDYVSDMSDSAGTSWLNVSARGWSDALLTASGMNMGQMPRLVEGTEVAGRLRPDLAVRWGLSASVLVAGGGGDNAAAACGAGVLREGQGFISLGTSGVMLAARDRYRASPETAIHTFCHAVPDRWYQMGVILAATDCLNWLGEITGQSPAQLTHDLGADLQDPSQLLFLPYLSGERTPHNDSQIRGSFVGLDVSTTTADMTRAVMEGVSFALRDSYEALKSTGAQMDEVLALGGGTKSRLWVKMVATVLDLPLCLPKDGDFGAALGAARLAYCAAMKVDPEVAFETPEIAEVVQPDKNKRAAFDAAYERYRSLYPLMKLLT